MGNPTGIGVSLLRKEDMRFITGHGNYVADIKRPDMLMGAFLRSPHAHAVIKSIDTNAALASPGVVAVFTGEDLKADGVGGLPCAWPVIGKGGMASKEPLHPALAQGKVRCVGDAVAFVIAETIEQARAGAEAVVVDYEPLTRGGRRARCAQARRSRVCSTTFPTTSASTGSWATSARPTPHSRRRRTSPRSAWSTTGWSAIRWSRVR